MTKSDLVTRDLDVFEQTPTVVAMTVTTLREDDASLIEPYAPPPDRRVFALQKIVDRGVVAVARVDPIIPTINDDEGDLERLVSVLADVGVRQVTISTMKPVKGFFSTLKRTTPEVYGRLVEIYADGRRVMGYKYLSEEGGEEFWKGCAQLC